MHPRPASPQLRQPAVHPSPSSRATVSISRYHTSPNCLCANAYSHLRARVAHSIPGVACSVQRFAANLLTCSADRSDLISLNKQALCLLMSRRKHNAKHATVRAHAPLRRRLRSNNMISLRPFALSASLYLCLPVACHVNTALSTHTYLIT